MANAQNLLQAAKKQKENGGAQRQATPNRQPARQMMESAMATSSDLGSLENLYFNPQDVDNDPLTEAYEVYPNGQKRKVYDPEEDMKQLASFNVSNVQSNMPQAILESILSDPLNMPTDGVAYNGSDVNDMMDGLQNRTMDILEKLDARDRQGKIGRPQYQQQYQAPQQPQMDMRQMINETQQMQPAVDYKALAQLIEAIIDKKFAQYSKTMLNVRKTNHRVEFVFLNIIKFFEMDRENYRFIFFINIIKSCIFVV